MALNLRNGNTSSTFYGYFFQSDIPVIDFGLKNEYAKTNWAIAAFSSEEKGSENGGAINIVVGNQKSYLHSKYCAGATIYPHFPTIEMRQAFSSRALTLSQRDGQRKVEEIEILISINNSIWESLGNFMQKNYGGQQVIHLPTIKTCRYFKIESIRLTTDSSLLHLLRPA